MSRKPTSFDIAQLAGVSQPTVSRALSGNPTVSEKTRLRVQAIAAQLNYTVDKNASSLRKRATNTLALLFYEDPTPDQTGINPFFLSMLGSMVRACSRERYDLLISMQHMASNWHVEFEESRKADGIILLGHGDFEPYRAKLDQLIEQGTHFVRWGHVNERSLGTVIGCDNFRGGYDATQHLIAQGRRKIAFLGHANERYPEFFDRYRGCCEAQRSAGIKIVDARQEDAIITEQSGHKAVNMLIERGVTFDAIFAASDMIAIGALRALAERGIGVPSDIAVVGFDDLPAASLTSPPLTTVQQDFKLAGELLVDALIRRIRNEDADTAALPAKLIVRKSCGAK
jgi:DNA-binding LacI/PurR family transcriptional regulator